MVYFFVLSIAAQGLISFTPNPGLSYTGLHICVAIVLTSGISQKRRTKEKSNCEKGGRFHFKSADREILVLCNKFERSRQIGRLKPLIT